MKDTLIKMKKMKVSAGTAIIYKDKILLCHPTKSKWTNTFSPPKGGLDKGETLIEAALRETREEVGIRLTPSQISNIDDPMEFIYTNAKGIVHKKVYIFVVKIRNLSEIKLEFETLSKSKLQVSEVDWAGFLTKEEASNKIFFRFNKLLDLI